MLCRPQRAGAATAATGHGLVQLLKNVPGVQRTTSVQTWLHSCKTFPAASASRHNCSTCSNCGPTMASPPARLASPGCRPAARARCLLPARCTPRPGYLCRGRAQSAPGSSAQSVSCGGGAAQATLAARTWRQSALADGGRRMPSVLHASAGQTGCACEGLPPCTATPARPGISGLLRGGGGHLDGHVVVPQPVQFQRGASAALDALLCREHVSGGQLHADFSRVSAFVADSKGFLTCSSGLCKTWGAPRGACPSYCSSSG